VTDKRVLRVVAPLIFFDGPYLADIFAATKFDYLTKCS